MSFWSLIMEGGRPSGSAAGAAGINMLMGGIFCMFYSLVKNLSSYYDAF